VYRQSELPGSFPTPRRLKHCYKRPPCDFRTMTWRTYVGMAGEWRYVYRAVDQHGQVIDVFVSPRREAAASKKFFAKAIMANGCEPKEVVTDKASIYPGVRITALRLGRSRPRWYASTPPTTSWPERLNKEIRRPVLGREGTEAEDSFQ
jgi:hypothetical protein